MPRFEHALRSFFYQPDEDGGAGLDQLPEPQVAPAVAPEEAPREFLAFRLDAETYALPLATVREIVKVPALTEVPRGGPHLHGVMHLRGEVLPVYDVKVRLRLRAEVAPLAGPTDAPRSARVVLVKDLAGDAGILVDEVHEVVRLLPSALEPAPALGAERVLVNGLARRGERLYILLDPNQVLP